MADHGHQRIKTGDDITLGAANMIAIKHQLDTGQAKPRQQICGLGRGLQEIARRIMPV